MIKEQIKDSEFRPPMGTKWALGNSCVEDLSESVRYQAGRGITSELFVILSDNISFYVSRSLQGKMLQENLEYFMDEVIINAARK